MEPRQLRISRYWIAAILMLFLPVASGWSQTQFDNPDKAFSAAVETLRAGNFEQAIGDFDRLAKSKHRLSSIVLGKIYLEGGYVVRDFVKAREYLSADVIEAPIGLLYEQQLRIALEEADIRPRNLPPDRFDRLMELGEKRSKVALLTLAIMGMNTDDNSKYQKIRKLMQAMPSEIDLRLAPSIEFFDPLRDYKRPLPLYESEIVAKRRRIESLSERGVPFALLLRARLAGIDGRKSNADLGREKWGYLALLIMAGNVEAVRKLPNETQQKVAEFALTWAQSLAPDFEPARPMTWCIKHAEGREQQCMLGAVHADKVCNFEGFGEGFANWETSRAYFNCRMRTR
jgi:hypothetical protein